MSQKDLLKPKRFISMLSDYGHGNRKKVKNIIFTKRYEFDKK